MKIIDVLEQLEESKIFKDWKQNNPDDYLVNFFKFMQTVPQGIGNSTILNTQSSNETPWQIGFYNKKTDMITTFDISDEIRINEPSEVFKKDNIVQELKIEDIKIDYEQALNSAARYQEEVHRNEKPMKIIMIIQNNAGVMYNITFITQTLKTLNIKISPIDGSVMETKLTNLMDFKRDE